jgi:uncharacterized protein (TIGR03000 family)
MPSFGYNYGGYTYPTTYYVMPYYGMAPYQAAYYTPQEQTPATQGAPTRPAAPPGTPDRDLIPPPTNPGSSQGEVLGEAPATLVVHLPAEARLTVDGQPTRSTSDRRVFMSPPLTPGKTYHYVLQAQMQRNGETLRASQNVNVRAGRESEVYLEFPVQGVSRR